MLDWRSTFGQKFNCVIDSHALPQDPTCSISVAEKLSWFIRQLSDGLYIFYLNRSNFSSDIWAEPSKCLMILMNTAALSGNPTAAFSLDLTGGIEFQSQFAIAPDVTVKYLCFATGSVNVILMWCVKCMPHRAVCSACSFKADMVLLSLWF